MQQKRLKRRRYGGESLRLLQVNCQSIGNKKIEFLNLVETYSRDVVIATESWLHEDVNSNEIIRGTYEMYRRDRGMRGGGVFICVRRGITSCLKWADTDHEILCVQILGKEMLNSLQVIGAYRAPNENFSLLDRRFDYTCTGKAMLTNLIVAGDLNLPYVNWSGEAASRSMAQLGVNKLLREGGFSQVVDFPTRGNNTLDVFLVRPPDLVISCMKVSGISDHSGVELNIKHSENPLHVSDKAVKILLYNRADQRKFQDHLNESFVRWASEGRHINILWNNFLNIVNGAIDKFVPFKVLKQNPGQEYYTREIRRLKRKLKKAYNKRRDSYMHMQKFKLLSKELININKAAHENYMLNLLGGSGDGWKKSYAYVRRRKGNSNDLAMIMSGDGRLITEKQEIANELNTWYGSVFNKLDSCVLDLNDVSNCPPSN